MWLANSNLLSDLTYIYNQPPPIPSPHTLYTCKPTARKPHAAMSSADTGTYNFDQRPFLSEQIIASCKLVFPGCVPDVVSAIGPRGASASAACHLHSTSLIIAAI